MIEILGVSYTLGELVLHSLLVLGVIGIAIVGQPYSDKEIKSKKKMLIMDSYNKRFRK